MFSKKYPNQRKLEFISSTCEVTDNGNSIWLNIVQGLLTEASKFVPSPSCLFSGLKEATLII